MNHDPIWFLKSSTRWHTYSAPGKGQGMSLHWNNLQWKQEMGEMRSHLIGNSLHLRIWCKQRFEQKGWVIMFWEKGSFCEWSRKASGLATGSEKKGFLSTKTWETLSVLIFFCQWIQLSIGKDLIFKRKMWWDNVVGFFMVILSATDPLHFLGHFC